MKQKQLFDATGGAEFSPCRRYRYGLYRQWDEDKPFLTFIGLNPSTASEQQDDPTIRRVVRFARDWGYGGINMANLFALVSTDPQALVAHPDAVGNNDEYLRVYADMSKDVLFAWGSFKEAKKRAEAVIEMFPAALCLGLNKDGAPKHPLYVPAITKPVGYRITACMG